MQRNLFVMKSSLEQILNEYSFVSDDIDIEAVLRDTVKYINKLESDNKTLEEIISIQRHNLSLLRKEKKNQGKGGK